MVEGPFAMLLLNLLGWAVMAGVGWNRLSEIKNRQSELVSLLREQNSRIDKLEEYKARREGWTEGYGTAKERYQNGDTTGAS
jgi:hypothetical protein